MTESEFIDEIIKDSVYVLESIRYFPGMVLAICHYEVD